MYGHKNKTQLCDSSQKIYYTRHSIVKSSPNKNSSCTFLDKMMHCFTWKINTYSKKRSHITDEELYFFADHTLVVSSLDLLSGKKQQVIISDVTPNFSKDFSKNLDCFVPISLLFKNIGYILYVDDNLRMKVLSFQHNGRGYGEVADDRAFLHEAISPSVLTIKLSKDDQYPFYMWDSSCIAGRNFVPLFRIGNSKEEMEIHYKVIPSGVVDIDLMGSHMEYGYSVDKVLLCSENGNMILVSSKDVMHDDYISYPDNANFYIYPYSDPSNISLSKEWDFLKCAPPQYKYRSGKYPSVHFVYKYVAAFFYKVAKNELFFELTQEHRNTTAVAKITFNDFTNYVPVTIPAKPYSYDFVVVNMYHNSTSEILDKENYFIVQAIFIGQVDNYIDSSNYGKIEQVVCKEFSVNALDDINDFIEKITTMLTSKTHVYDVSREKKFLCDAALTVQPKQKKLLNENGDGIDIPFHLITESQVMHAIAQSQIYINARTLIPPNHSIIRIIARRKFASVGCDVISTYGKHSCGFSGGKVNCFALQQYVSLENKFVMYSLDLLSGKIEYMSTSKIPSGFMGKFFDFNSKDIYANTVDSFIPSLYIINNTVGYTFYKNYKCSERNGSKQNSCLQMDVFSRLNSGSEFASIAQNISFTDDEISPEFVNIRLSGDAQYPIYVWDPSTVYFIKFIPLLRIGKIFQHNYALDCRVIPGCLLDIVFMNNYNAHKIPVLLQNRKIYLMSAEDIMYDDYDAKYCNVTYLRSVGDANSYRLPEKWDCILNDFPKTQEESFRQRFSSPKKHGAFHMMQENLLIYFYKYTRHELFIERLYHKDDAKMVDKVTFNNNLTDYFPVSILTKPDGTVVLFNIDYGSEIWKSDHYLLFQAIFIDSNYTSITKTVCSGFYAHEFADIRIFLATLSDMVDAFTEHTNGTLCDAVLTPHYCKDSEGTYDYNNDVSNYTSRPFELMSEQYTCAISVSSNDNNTDTTYRNNHGNVTRDKGGIAPYRSRFMFESRRNNYTKVSLQSGLGGSRNNFTKVPTRSGFCGSRNNTTKALSQSDFWSSRNNTTEALSQSDFWSSRNNTTKALSQSGFWSSRNNTTKALSQSDFWSSRNNTTKALSQSDFWSSRDNTTKALSQSDFWSSRNHPTLQGPTFVQKSALEPSEIVAIAAVALVVLLAVFCLLSKACKKVYNKWKCSRSENNTRLCGRMKHKIHTEKLQVESKYSINLLEEEETSSLSATYLSPQEKVAFGTYTENSARNFTSNLSKGVVKATINLVQHGEEWDETSSTSSYSSAFSFIHADVQSMQQVAQTAIKDAENFSQDDGEKFNDISSNSNTSIPGSTYINVSSLQPVIQGKDLNYEKGGNSTWV